MNRHIKSMQWGGATLLFVVVVLIIITVLGLASARSTLLQERMASVTGGHNVVLQAAEAALIEIEERIVSTDPVEFRKNFQSRGCVKGYCALTAPAPEPPWMADNFWKDKGKLGKATPLTVPPFGEITSYYVIEDTGYSTVMCDPQHIDVTPGTHCPLVPGQRQYQITVLAQTPQGMSAMLQSQFFDPHPAVK